MKLSIFVGILHVLRFDFQKFRNLEILNFHPCAYRVNSGYTWMMNNEVYNISSQSTLLFSFKRSFPALSLD